MYTLGHAEVICIVAVKLFNSPCYDPQRKKSYIGSSATIATVFYFSARSAVGAAVSWSRVGVSVAFFVVADPSLQTDISFQPSSNQSKPCK